MSAMLLVEVEGYVQWKKGQLGRLRYSIAAAVFKRGKVKAYAVM